MEQSRHAQGVTSVKVHHTPGGGSSIQLGGGYGGEGSELDSKPKNAAAASAPAAADANKDEEEKKDENTDGQAAAGTGAVGEVRRVADGTASVTDAFGNKVSGTSIRVRAPPGGASSITF